jgi:hypothetical protein
MIRARWSSHDNGCAPRCRGIGCRQGLRSHRGRCCGRRRRLGRRGRLRPPPRLRLPARRRFLLRVPLLRGLHRRLRWCRRRGNRGGGRGRRRRLNRDAARGKLRGCLTHESGVQTRSCLDRGNRSDCHVCRPARRVRRKLAHPRGSGCRSRRMRFRRCGGRILGFFRWGMRRCRGQVAGLARRACRYVDGGCASGCQQARPCCERDLPGRERECSERCDRPSLCGRR